MLMRIGCGWLQGRSCTGVLCGAVRPLPVPPLPLGTDLLLRLDTVIIVLSPCLCAVGHLRHAGRRAAAAGGPRRPQAR